MYHSTVAWDLDNQGGRNELSFATITNGTCQTFPDRVLYGNGGAPTPVGLIDETHALIVDDFSNSSGHVAIYQRQGGVLGNRLAVSFGGTQNPKSIVVGGGYAVIVTDNIPVVVSFF